MRWVARHLPPGEHTVLDFGGANVNGLPPGVADRVVIDNQPGLRGVDIIADARTYQHPQPVDVVLCLEVAEHCPRWQELVANAARNLTDDGCLIFTAAGPARAPHSAWGAANPVAGEYYANVDLGELLAAGQASFETVVVDEARDGQDVRLFATKPKKGNTCHPRWS